MGSCGGGGDREIRVRIVKEEMVTPAARSTRRRSTAAAEKEIQKKRNGTVEEEEEEERMFLSSSDIFCRNNPHNRRILFYEAPSQGVDNGNCDGEYAEMVARLKRSLRVALDAFYPLAGRLHVAGTDRLHVQ